MTLSPQSVLEAHARIAPFIHRTPLLESSLLNGWLSARVLFKVEALQKVGAFKIRGALNTLLSAKERGNLPDRVVAFSSGNHAQAVACAARMLGVKATIYAPAFVSPIKLQATRAYGAEVILTQTRRQAEEAVVAEVTQGAYLVPPYDLDEVIAGQGTACLEALQDGPLPDAVFAACGGGGFLSGTWLAAQAVSPGIKVYGAEPIAANDAARSLREGRIVRLQDSPATIADGVATLSVSPRTFFYLRQLAGIIEVEECYILYWTQWLMHLLKITVEPTSALAMAAAAQWLDTQGKGKTLLVLLSAGNIAPATYRKIWQEDHLQHPPGRKETL